MKNLALFLLVILTFAACKKSSEDPSQPPPPEPLPKENYVKIDDDSRLIGDVPSADIDYVEEKYPQETLLVLAISKKALNIDDSKNEYLIINIVLFEGTSDTEYKIENVTNRSPSSASITFILQGNDINASMTGKAGKLYVTRDANNKVKSFRFENVEMDGTYEATVSCNIIIE
jgi:hypothetical protein